MKLRTQIVPEIESLYREHRPALLLFAKSICGERARAEDAVQQVFLNLMDGRKLQATGNPKAYLFACVRNGLLNQRKSLQRDVTLCDQTAWFEPPDRDYIAESSLRSGLLGLPDEQREVVVLHVWGELAFSEIGEVLGLNANTVASRYRYAIGKLREVMMAKEASRDNSR